MKPYQGSIAFLPPSPTSPTTKNESMYFPLQVNTELLTPSPSPTPPLPSSASSSWKEPFTLYSPPVSPLTSIQDRTNQNTKKRSTPSPPPMPPAPWELHWKSVNVEQLTLENAKLQRANRLLKVDTERRVAEQLEPLDRRIETLTIANIRWQRSARLLQQELDDAKSQFDQWKLRALTNSQWMGPEYQFLVNTVNALQHQAQGKNEDCWEARAAADPTMTQLRKLLYQEHNLLASPNQQRVQDLEQELQLAQELLDEQAYDILTLKTELQHKNQLVTSLEKEINAMDDRLDELQELLGANSLTGHADLLKDHRCLPDAHDLSSHWHDESKSKSALLSLSLLDAKHLPDHDDNNEQMTRDLHRRPTSSIYSSSTLMTSHSSFSGAPELISFWKDAAAELQKDLGTRLLVSLPGAFPTGTSIIPPSSRSMVDTSHCFLLLATSLALASFFGYTDDVLKTIPI
ncbi:hypothetical protein DM01DRAFT_1404825 [Hesseltinella vesiculosa]|uniref:Uncharacterized protein n=1 Tax=Hesseltinella vesiculosa TaxID=101127 RepID=A0A1X2GSU5_9FUNG|nr:hypothetical protein DM01DRAFT_1404825 [Hesseltinella vesiculosa]